MTNVCLLIDELCMSFLRTLTDHIAEIYFRAWKKASGEALEEMETACIQDFMQHAILLHRNTPVHPRVRQVEDSVSASVQNIFKRISYLRVAVNSSYPL